MQADELLTAEPYLSDTERQLRDGYVEEYFKDFSTINAAIRMGYIEESAVEFAKQMWYDPYVQRAIADRNAKRCSWLTPVDDGSRSASATEEEDKQRIVSALFKEMHATGAGSSQTGRIAAARELAKIYQLDKPEKEEASKVLTNVMIVPQVTSVDDWAAMAAESQAKLKEDVKK